MAQECSIDVPTNDFIYQTLRPTSNIVAWIDWGDSLQAVALIALIGLALTLVPTLLMTRKYLKV